MGADINGPNSQYEESPAQAAISAKDPVLIRALLDRGMLLSRKDTCLASSAVGRQLLDENGIEVAQILLGNGLTTDCLDSASVYDNLLFGCGTENYDVSKAITAVEFLAKRGFAVTTRDRYGKNIFDRIEANTTCRVKGTLLVDALQRISIDFESRAGVNEITHTRPTISKRKNWRPIRESFAPPSRDDL
jgi:hypothetical protein